jgi:hypothetical protein
MHRRVVSLKQTDVSEVHTAPIIALMMEAVRTSETSVYNETTRRYIPESCHLHTRHGENLKSHSLGLVIVFFLLLQWRFGPF